MAEKEQEKKEDEEGAEPKSAPNGDKKRKKKLIIIGAAVTVLLIVIGVTVALYLSFREPEGVPSNLATAKNHEVVLEGAGEEEVLEENEKPLGAMFPLDTFMVNLIGEKRYLRCQIQIEFEQRDIPRKFYTQMVPIKDAIIELLAQQDPKDLATQKGRADLKDRVREVINEKLRREEVRMIYFTQFVVQ